MAGESSVTTPNNSSRGLRRARLRKVYRPAGPTAFSEENGGDRISRRQRRGHINCAVHNDGASPN